MNSLDIQYLHNVDALDTLFLNISDNTYPPHGQFLDKANRRKYEIIIYHAEFQMLLPSK